MKILVGYLKTPEGAAALERAAEEAALRKAKLVVLHSMRGGARGEDAEVITYRQALAQVESDLGGRGIDFEVREMVRGNSPAEDLIAFSEQSHVDLIVIGLRRRSPVGKLVLGSNAQDILLRADCAVLAVKAPHS